MLAKVDDDTAIALTSKGAVGRAIALERQAVVESEALWGAAHPGTLRTRANLGSGLTARGEHDEAIAFLTEPIAIAQQTPGARMVLINMLECRAWSFSEEDRHAEALADSEHGATVVKEAHLESTIDGAAMLTTMAHVLRRAGRLERALATAGEAVTTATTVIGAGGDRAETYGGDLAEAKIEVAAALLAASRPAAAIAPAREAVALEDGSKPLPLVHTRALLTLGTALDASAKHAEAVSVLERAVATGEGHEGDTVTLADARFALAQALPSDRPRARSLAAAARDEYAKNPHLVARRTAAEKWLEAHP
jgi:tetratricopeptide (TPR) repeat protein